MYKRQTRDREELYDRINRRVDQMMEEGLLDEVRSVLSYRHLNSLNTVGYKEQMCIRDRLPNVRQWYLPATARLKSGHTTTLKDVSPIIVSTIPVSYTHLCTLYTATK